MPKEKNKIDINKHEIDISTLKKQNVNDLLSIKELYRKLKEVEEKITQIKYVDNTLVNKLKKEYEKLKRIILDENIQVKLTNDIDKINSKMNTKANKSDIETINSELDNITNDISKTKDLSPYYIEGFISFNKWGIGTPNDVSNYADNNYVVTVSGNRGNSFVTVNAGNISHGGGMWHCVIKTQNGYIHNKVIGIEGNKFLLLKPLLESFSNCLLSNMQDIINGQHFTQEGYYAYSNYIYNYNPKHADREKWLYKFKNTDTTGKWVNNNGWLGYNMSKNINDATYNYYVSYGKQFMRFDFTSLNSNLEWEVNLNGKNGYLECFVGSENLKEVIAEFYLDNELKESKTFNLGTKLIFDYKDAKIGKIKFKINEFTERFTLRVGTTTWFENREKYNRNMLTSFKKLAYIGDSWGEFQNKATSRELSKLLGYEVANYSKAGHTCKYALHWFDEYIIKNKHDGVIIEYFTNDFNSINGTVQPTFTGIDGQKHDMNLSSIDEYVTVMNEMIKKCKENGIQPIIILPFSTNSLGQAQSFSDYAQQIFQGVSSLVENLEIKTINSEEITSNKIATTEVKSNTSVKLISNEMIQSLRKGVVVSSDDNVTNGNLFTCVNNNVSVFGVDYRGVSKNKGSLFTPFPVAQATESYNRGLIYLVNNITTTSGNDELRIIIQLSDGTFKEKRIVLEDI